MIDLTANDASAADRSTSRIINRKVLMEYIYRSNGISKSKLADMLGLSKPAVSRNVAELLSLGLVEERGTGESTKNGGKRPVMLHFNQKYQYIGVVDISGHRPACAIGDLNHNLLQRKVVKVHKEASVNEKRLGIARAFKDMMNDLAIPAEKLGVLVISHPGIMGADNDIRFVSTRHSWTNIGLKSYLEDEFSTQVIMDNNVRLAALGEMNQGVDEPSSEMLYVSCGVGIGGGLIINGKVYEGRNRAAGEIGNFILCNGRSVEGVASINNLISRTEELYAENNRSPEELDFDKIIELSKSGDALVNKCVVDVGQVLGLAIYNASVLLDIQTVIFGGDYVHLGDVLFDAIDEFINRKTADQHAAFRPKVQRSRLQGMAEIYGGFIMGKDMVLQQRLGIA